MPRTQQNCSSQQRREVGHSFESIQITFHINFSMQSSMREPHTLFPCGSVSLGREFFGENFRGGGGISVEGYVRGGFFRQPLLMF